MLLKSLFFRPLGCLICYCFSIGLTAQIDQFELAASDELYAFEMARIQQDFDAMIGLTFPPLFRLIDKISLREQLEQLAIHPPAYPKQLPNFRVQRVGDPIETDRYVYLRLSMRYDHWNPKAINLSVERTVLAIRINAELKWYFLEIGNGQNTLLSSIIPAKLLD